MDMELTDERGVAGPDEVGNGGKSFRSTGAVELALAGAAVDVGAATTAARVALAILDGGLDAVETVDAVVVDGLAVEGGAAMLAVRGAEPLVEPPRPRFLLAVVLMASAARVLLNSDLITGLRTCAAATE